MTGDCSGIATMDELGVESVALSKPALSTAVLNEVDEKTGDSTVMLSVERQHSLEASQAQHEADAIIEAEFGDDDDDW